MATEVLRLRQCLSVFLSPEKEKLEKKELQGGCPLDPRCGERHHNRMGYQREDSVQAAQRGQDKARTVKHSAANYPWLPLEGKAERTVFAPNTETFSAVHNISVAAATGRTRSPGGLGGRSRIEFIVSPLSRRRHNESHFAAQSPERAFLAKPFFARAKNGVNSGRRSHKISVDKSKSIDKPSPQRVRPTIHLNHI